VPTRLVRTFLPRADVRLYLAVPAEVSVARKPDDVLGEYAVRRQLESYEGWLDVLPPTVRLDATRTTDDLVGEVLELVTSARQTRRGDRGKRSPRSPRTV
jgi:thymidylate kinase